MKNIDLPVAFSKTSLLLVIFMTLFLGSAGVWAKPDTGPKNTALDMTKDSLQAKIEAINTRQGLDEALKTKVLSIYQSAQDNLGNIERFKAQTIGFNQAIKEAPEKTKQLQKDIEQTLLTVSKQKPEDFSKLATAELEQRLNLEKGKISSLDEQLKKLDNELALQQARPQRIREETIIAKQDLDESRKKLEAPSDTTSSNLETEAHQVYLKTLIDSRTAELKMLDVEATSNPARVELLKTGFRLLEIQKNALNPVITAIDNLLTERRQQEDKNQQEALSQEEKELAGKPLIIQALTRENIQYTRDLQAITAKIERYTAQKTKVDAQTSEIEKDFKSAEKKISLAGLSPALGKILREQRRNLATWDQLASQSETIQNETAITSLEQFKIEDKLKQLTDIDAGVHEIMDQQVDPKLPLEERKAIQDKLRELLNSQNELLNKLAMAYTTYLRTLGDYDFARQQMVSQATQFAGYLDENLLWVKSSDPVNTGYIAGLFHSATWLISPFNWMALIKDALKLSLQNPFLIFFGVVSLTLLLLYKKWVKQQLAAISVNVEQMYTDNFNYTLQAFAYTLILVLPVPLFCYYLGWFLSSNSHVADFTRAIGVGLQSAAKPLFFLQFFYRLFAEEGVARIHFQWQKNTVRVLRKQIAWLRFVAVLSVFIINCTAASKVSIHSDSMGRLALIISMIAMAVFGERLLSPNRGLIKDYINAHPDGWINKLRYIWYPAVISIPVVIIGFAVAGYYLSALELQEKLIVSLRLIFLMVIIHALVVRWLTLVNRQLAIKNARQKRKAAFLTEKQPAAGGEDPVLPVDEELIDIPKINAQTIRLLNVFISLSVIAGFWVIWKNILPAFSFLDRIVLWQRLVTLNNQQSYEPVTMTNLMSAGLYFFIAVVSVRNFSGIMELLVFRRFSIEAGGRYAVNQLANYTLVAIGFISIANELGGSWSQVQWLVAALSVGLGFGLQEIFANLVSGIILLFERPIRVGDTVTIGTVTGKVSRIQMRATTLIDWDQKEHVVPNKTFITSQLVNWTLSDTITRVEVSLGIAYGSDVEMAHKVLLDTLLSTPLILTEPAPSVFMAGFGENALMFSVRFFVSELANRLPVTHDLHMRLEKALREHKMEIPFPQRDIHIRSVTQEIVAPDKAVEATVPYQNR